MSQGNVEIVRAVYEGWLAGDPGYERFDPEIAMVESKALPGAVEACGIDEVRRYMESMTRYWDELRFEPLEYIEAGDGRVLRMEGYADRAEAPKAAGLAD